MTVLLGHKKSLSHETNGVCILDKTTEQEPHAARMRFVTPSSLSLVSKQQHQGKTTSLLRTGVSRYHTVQRLSNDWVLVAAHEAAAASARKSPGTYGPTRIYLHGPTRIYLHGPTRYIYIHVKGVLLAARSIDLLLPQAPYASVRKQRQAEILGLGHDALLCCVTSQNRRQGVRQQHTC
jgi:hypothetical protein